MSEVTLDLLLLATTIEDVMKVLDSIPDAKLTGIERHRAFEARKELREARAFVHSLILRGKQV